MAHLRLSYGCFSKRHEPIRNRMNSVKVNSSSKLRFGVSRNRRRFEDALVCFAAFDGDDARDNQPELGSSGGVGSAVEDRPGKIKIHYIYKKNCSIITIIIFFYDLES